MEGVIQSLWKLLLRFVLPIISTGIILSGKIFNMSSIWLTSFMLHLRSSMVMFVERN